MPISPMKVDPTRLALVGALQQASLTRPSARCFHQQLCPRPMMKSAAEINDNYHNAIIHGIFLSTSLSHLTICVQIFTITLCYTLNKHSVSNKWYRIHRGKQTLQPFKSWGNKIFYLSQPHLIFICYFLTRTFFLLTLRPPLHWIIKYLLNEKKKKKLFIIRFILLMCCVKFQ